MKSRRINSGFLNVFLFFQKGVIMEEKPILDTVFQSEEQKEKFLDEVFKEMVKRAEKYYRTTGNRIFE